MRIFVTALLLCTYTFLLNAQKVDIDKYRIYVEYASLPKHKVGTDNRTYSLDVAGKYKFDKNEILNSLNLRGWTYVQDNGTVVAKLRVHDFVRGNSSKKKRTVEKKNKEGEVTSTTHYYRYSSKNTGRASLNLYGPDNSMSKQEKEKKSKKDKEEIKKANNPFLAGTDNVGGDSDVEEGEHVGKFDLSQNYTVKGNEYTSATKAYDDYKSISNQEYSEQLENYQANVISRANYYLNTTYGYKKLRDRARFKRLDSENHPEYKMFDNATTALKELFSRKKFNRNYDDLISAIGPIEDYFKTVVEKYSKNDKHPKRLKAAAMYNLAQIYYYTDQPDKVIAIGNDYIRWGHDKKDGEKFVKKAQKLKEQLAFHGISGRYFETDEDADAIESEDLETEDGGR